MNHRLPYVLLFFVMSLFFAQAQEESPFIAYDVPSQNLLKFNRFLINPTFSTVREDKSYFNFLHRNQSVSFDDNNQTYFLSYSGRINDRTGLGLSLYTQQEGIISNYGILANYAYGLKLSDKSNFTFGANVSYYNSGFDESRANPVEIDPLLGGFQDNSLLSFQPGFNFSYGKFDFGVFAENLFDYNLKTSETLTDFKDKTFSSHLQYTHTFENARGVLEQARLMPLARARKVGEDELVFGGNLILDLPKLGWLQGGYDSFYGASAGVGFNLNRRLSLGYTMEKGLSNNFDNFGVTHEISFAYSFTPNLTEDRVMLEDNPEELVDNSEEEENEELLAETSSEIEELKKKLAENDEVLAELMFRQDSIEAARKGDLERRFEMVMRMVRQETRGNRPDLEERAKKLYYAEADDTQLAGNVETFPDPLPNTTSTNAGPSQPREVRTDRVAAVSDAKTKNKVVADRTAVASSSNPKTRKFRDLQDVEKGYYVIVNVYKGPHYMNKFINTLQDKGINASYIDHPKTKLKYVYLERYDTWEDAVAAYKSNFNGQYSGEMWIMNVEDRYSNEAYAENTRKVKEKATQYEADVLRKNVVVRDNVAATEDNQDNFNVRSGNSAFYIIVNVFAKPRNAKRFVQYLNDQGLSASFFINPENNYRYVYVKRHNSWNNALISYYTKLNDAYDDKMWIMRVTPNLIT